MILHLGVIDVPYNRGGVTTAQVAKWLEGNYHVMLAFYLKHQQQIADDLTDGLAGTLDNVLMGAPVPPDIFATGTGKIKNQFSVFLTTQEMDGLGVQGVPTLAAREGISHRFKSKKGPSRPSFVDTGLFEASFMAWIED